MRLLKSTRLIPRLGSEETRVHTPQLRDRTKLSGGRKLRHELKFIINEGTYLMLRARLAPLMTVDPHGVNGEYRVTSLYFDDVYNSAYWQKVNGIETRRKFRIRAYDLDPSLITLESKHKDASYVSKLSRRLTDEQYRALLSCDCGFMADSDSDEDSFGEFYRADLLTKLRPRVIVDYRRQALISRFGNVRITFDKQLSACFNTMDMFAPEAQYTPVLGGDIILEVKFDSYIPESIQAALQGLNAPQQSVSKYMICTDRMLEVLTHG